MKYLVVMTGVVFWVTSVVAGPVYQWKDANGNTVFSDQAPEGIGQVQQSHIPTHPDSRKAYQEHPYSIQNQVEFFQAMAEREQKMRLERKAAQQAYEAQQAQQYNYVMPPLDDGLPPIVPVPYRYPYYPQHPVPNRMVTPGYITNPYGYPVYTGPSVNYTHQGDHHRFNLKLGGYNSLHYRHWKF